MSNEITINPIEIFKLEDNSVTDAETIRQIALWSIKFNDNSLASKIKHELQFAGLYPHVQNYDPEVAKKISESDREFINKILDTVHVDKQSMKVDPGISLTPEFKLEGQYPRTAMHYDSNDENYQKELNLDKYEIMLSANKKSLYPVGHLHKFTNEIFNKKTGIAFFQIDKEWDVLWTRKFTGFFDKHKEELYDGDIIQNEKGHNYLISWHRHTCSWDIERTNYSTKELNSDDFVMYIEGRQSLGNGYFKRDDMEKIGNKYENPELLKDHE